MRPQPTAERPRNSRNSGLLVRPGGGGVGGAICGPQASEGRKKGDLALPEWIPPDQPNESGESAVSRDQTAAGDRRRGG